MSLPATPAFTVETALWARDAQAIAQVRRAVFIEEQLVPEEMEWEDRDAVCDWFLARSEGAGVLGIARLVPEGLTGLSAGVGVVGRMAVLPDWRRRGVGSALLRAALARARQRHMRQVVLHAQTQALAFYQRHGFVPQGEAFQEAGIAHRLMVLNLEV
jgi:predicted GNAT family N-acyltransferase